MNMMLDIMEKNRILFVRNVRILSFLFESVVFDTHVIDMTM